jgi:hypothetical protein
MLSTISLIEHIAGCLILTQFLERINAISQKFTNEALGALRERR